MTSVAVLNNHRWYTSTNNAYPTTQSSQPSYYHTHHQQHTISYGFAKIASSSGDHFIWEPVVTLGRRSSKAVVSSQSFISLSSSYVSRQHAKISWNEDGAYFDITALSRYGLWVNEQFVGIGDTPVRLKHNNNITIGDVLLVFMLPNTFDDMIERDRKEHPHQRCTTLHHSMLFIYRLDVNVAASNNTNTSYTSVVDQPMESIPTMLDTALYYATAGILDMSTFVEWVTQRYAMRYQEWFLRGHWRGMYCIMQQSVHTGNDAMMTQLIVQAEREIRSNPKYLSYHGANTQLGWHYGEYFTLREKSGPFCQLFPGAIASLRTASPPNPALLASSSGIHPLISNWAPHNVRLFLLKLSVPEHALRQFDYYAVDGTTLLRLTDPYLQSMGIINQIERELILSAVTQLNAQYIASTPTSSFESLPAAAATSTTIIETAGPLTVPSSDVQPVASSPSLSATAPSGITNVSLLTSSSSSFSSPSISPPAPTAAAGTATSPRTRLTFLPPAAVDNSAVPQSPIASSPSMTSGSTSGKKRGKYRKDYHLQQDSTLASPSAATTPTSVTSKRRKVKSNKHRYEEMSENDNDDDMKEAIAQSIAMANKLKEQQQQQSAAASSAAVTATASATATTPSPTSSSSAATSAATTSPSLTPMEPPPPSASA